MAYPPCECDRKRKYYYTYHIDVNATIGPVSWSSICPPSFLTVAAQSREAEMRPSRPVPCPGWWQSMYGPSPHKHSRHRMSCVCVCVLCSSETMWRFQRTSKQELRWLLRRNSDPCGVDALLPCSDGEVGFWFWFCPLDSVDEKEMNEQGNVILCVSTAETCGLKPLLF